MPSRFISSVLQAEAKAAGIELARFGINTTIGLLGFFDVAENTFQIERQAKDLGQTLGKYGVGEGFYIVWPFTGPSNPRDTIGACMELFLSPWFQVQLQSSALASSLGMYDYFNTGSLHTNDYEELVNAAVEPYVALKNAYVQYRRNIVQNK
jgi:phospholipid-binding lipoprotein MlaA